MSDLSDATSESSVIEVSERETQFVPQEDDEEILWEVIEITAENRKSYKVRWAGLDPKTHKPWPLSWVPKRDCTDDLVLEWKRKQARKKKEADRRKSKQDSAKKLNDRSRTPITAKGSTTSSTVTAQQNRKSSTAAQRPPKELPYVNVYGKRAHDSVTSDAFDSHSEANILDDAEDDPPSPPKKKQKLEHVKNGDDRVHNNEKGDVSPVANQIRRTKEQPKPPDKGKGRARDVVETNEITAKPIAKKRAQRGHHLNRNGSVSSTLNREKVHTTKQSSPISSDPVQPKSVVKQRQALSASASSSDDDISPPSPLAVWLTSSYHPLSAKETHTVKRVSPKPIVSRQHKSTVKQKRTTAVAPASPSSPTPSEDLPPPKRLTLPSTSSRRLVKTGSSNMDKAIPGFKPPPKLSSDRVSRDPRLSPGAIARLERFDTEMLALEHTEVEEGEVQDLDNALEDGEIQFPRGGLLNLSKSFNDRDSNTIAHQFKSPNPGEPESQFTPNQNTSPIPSTIPVSMSVSDELVPDKLIRAGNGRIFNDDSYRKGVVPETETESSNNTQSQSQSAPPLRNIIGPDGITASFPTPATPHRKSIISKMKPRTPVSASNSKIFSLEDFLNPSSNNPQESNKSDENNRKDIGTGPLTTKAATTSVTSTKTNGKSTDLRPIPVLSPSQFALHLPSTSVISQADYPEEEEVADLVSSIEQFSSPEKRTSRPRKEKKTEGRRVRASRSDRSAKGDVTDDASVTEQEPDSFEAAVRAPGQLAERAERTGKSGIGGGQAAIKKVTARDFLEANRRNYKGKRKEWDELRRNKGKFSGLQRREYILQPDVQSRDEPEAKKMQETEDIYSGGNDRPDKESEVVEKIFLDVLSQGEETEDLMLANLRQEEEESTQDLMLEQAINARGMDKVDVEMGWDVSGPSVRPEQEDVGTSENRSKFVEEVSTPMAPAEVPDQGHEDDVTRTEFRSERTPPNEHPASRPNSRSSSGQYTKPVQVPEHETVLPPTLSTHEPTPTPSPEKTPTETPQHLDAALTLLNVKSQEISRLDGLLIIEQTKTAALAKEVETLKNAPAADSGSQPREAELERKLAEAHDLLAQETAKWQNERLSLTTSITSLTQRQESAEKDRDFFREHYMQASGFVTSVRQENNELEVRARVAAEQAATGVEMIKATFQQRVKFLEDDVKSWQKLATFVMEKDVRTNDDVRRRAAEEPELRVRYEELTEQNEIMLDRLVTLQEDLDSRDKHSRELEAENVLWKKETMRLNVELNEVKARLDKNGKNMEGAEKDHDMVYRCQWRLEGGDSACEGLFRTVEELEAHLYTGGHLHA